MEQKENNFIESIIPALSKHFVIQREVWSKCGKGRIDLVLNPIGYTDVYFGVECKVPDKKRGDKIGEYVEQAMRYTKYEFNVSVGCFKKIPVLIYPPLSYKYFILNEEEKDIDGDSWHKDRHDVLDEHHSFNGFLGNWNVGEMRKANNDRGPNKKKNYSIISFSNQIIWSSKPKWNNDIRKYEDCSWVHEENYNKLLRKINGNSI